MAKQRFVIQTLKMIVKQILFSVNEDYKNSFRNFFSTK